MHTQDILTLPKSNADLMLANIVSQTLWSLGPVENPMLSVAVLFEGDFVHPKT